MVGHVVVVRCNPGHGSTKPNHEAIELLAGPGVARDVQPGTTSRHQYLVGDQVRVVLPTLRHQVLEPV